MSRTTPPRRRPARSLLDTIFDRQLARWRTARGIDGRPRGPRDRTVVILSFENAYATAGGLGAVMRHLPRALAGAGENILVLTPFHRRLPDVVRAHRCAAFSRIFHRLPLAFGKMQGAVSCLRDKSASVPTFLVDIEGCFEASGSPYGYADFADLVRDSLAFCQAAPFVCERLGFRDNIVFHAHDWETAAVALCSAAARRRGVLDRCATVLTLHNSFDAGIGPEAQQQFFGEPVDGQTILQCAIPYLQGPVTTVSSAFALELLSDPLQNVALAAHLQPCLRRGPILGIENGWFGLPQMVFTDEACARAGKNDVGLLVKEKAGFRRCAMRLIAEHAGDGTMGRLTVERRSRVPLFFMSGRLDPGQKGFDVAVRAFSRLRRGAAKMFYCPAVDAVDGERRRSMLGFLGEMASVCEGDLVVWPQRLSLDTYTTILRGSSYLLMPSFYEPFGAAAEGFAYGTPVIARATGGLLTQVSPVDPGGLRLPPYLRPLTAAWTVRPNGLLFREDNAPCEQGTQWRRILALPLADRPHVPLYMAMVDSMETALRRAIELFGDGVRYGSLIAGTLDAVKDSGWESAARRYRRVYDVSWQDSPAR